MLRQLGDNKGAAAEAKTGAGIAKQQTSEQSALFATNSGKRLLTAGDIDGAISQFRFAIESVPSYAPSHYQLGLALLRKGDKRAAAQEFKAAAALDPRLEPPAP